ncbi:Tumor necrosis factor alpha-induced protein 8-like protein 3, partial [Durusdinium trenchii]
MAGEEETAGAKAAPQEKKRGRRLTALGAKKAVASKIGESKVGRSALIKLMGPEGDAGVSALKEAVAKFEDRPTAKELKKDTFKWVLKASVLIQNKSLTRDNAAHLKRPALGCAERVVDICDRRPAGSRDMSKVSSELLALGDMLKALLESHSQDKNVAKIDKIVKYYANPVFLNDVMNKPAYQEERDTILASLKTILLPHASVLNDDESLAAAQSRCRTIHSEIDPDIHVCLNAHHPEMSSMFAKFLDARPDKAAALAMRFILAEHEFVQISAANLRVVRARVLFKKFVQFPVDGKFVVDDADERAKFQAAIDDEVVSRTIFAQSREKAFKLLVNPFNAFLTSRALLAFKQSLQDELAELQRRFGAKLDEPAPHMRKLAQDFIASAGCMSPFCLPSSNACPTKSSHPRQKTSRTAHEYPLYSTTASQSSASTGCAGLRKLAHSHGPSHLSAASYSVWPQRAQQKRPAAHSAASASWATTPDTISISRSAVAGSGRRDSA